MAQFIRNPQIVEAVKWDGSTDGAAEVRALLENAGSYIMGGSVLSHDQDGKPIPRDSYIKFYRGRTWPMESDWSKLYLGEWIVFDPNTTAWAANRVYTQKESFEGEWTEMSIVNQETLTNWLLEGQKKNNEET